MRNYESWSIRESTATIVTTKESKQKILSFYSKSFNKKTHIVENLESLTFQKKFKKNLKNTSCLRVIYFGSFAPHRGLETIIECSNLLLKEKKIEFYLIGALNNEYSKKIFNNKSNNLKVLKRINLKRLKNFTNNKSVGIVPHINNMHTNTTIPYKLSQYMCLGIPQIVSDCKPLVRTIKKSKSGLIYKSGNPYDLKKKIIEIQKLNFNKLKFNSLKYFKNNNWELKEHRNIINIYDKI